MPSIIIGLEKDGQEVRMASGDSLVLKLPENPTTGVRWSFEVLPDVLQVDGDHYEQTPGGGIGAAALRVLTLKPRGRGRTEVRLKRWQEWEGESSVDARFHCVVRIE